MNVQLKELIDKIKTEGVKEAEAQAAQIKNDAEQEAANIKQQAKSEADADSERSQREISQFEAASKEAIKQAGRDLILTVKSEMTKLFESIIQREITKALDVDTLKTAISSLLKEWGQQRTEDVQILISEENLQNIQDYVVGQMSAEIKKGVEIKPSSQIAAGFRISEKDGSAFFDFTDRGLAEFLMEYLNPRIAELLKV